MLPPPISAVTRTDGATSLRNVLRALSALPSPHREAILASITEFDASLIAHDWQIWARDDQLPPRRTATGRHWRTWLCLGGRGSGKTRAGAEWVRAVALGLWPHEPPARRIALVGPTQAHVRSVMIDGVSGLMAVHPPQERPVLEITKNQLVWPNGAIAQFFSAEDPEGLRGPQFDAAWCDELGRWKKTKAAWDMLQFGLRIGSRPRSVVTTTPRSTAVLKRIMADPSTVMTKARTTDNAANLAPTFIDEILRAYGNTTLGRQELDGEVIAERTDALWQRKWLVDARVATPPELSRIVVAVDPPVTATANADTCGIVVAGLGPDKRAYVLADRSIQGRDTATWARAVIAAYRDFSADRIVAEANQGGDMVVSVIRQVDANAPVKKVHASRGKFVRAEPISALYAADWSEYFGHQPADGSGDVHFHLDPLWSSAAIDAVSIDCYWPLADWRDGDSHLDRQSGVRSIHDLAYLKSNLFAGEGYDWHYASAADRDAQLRTPITDGAGKPWVFRYKDLRSWWQNIHYDRPSGIESATPTGWMAQSKPVWLTEIGCPAADKGANQPNVFVDPKSSESFLPYYSRGTRDDLVQRRYIQAFLEAFDPASPGHVAGANPVSSVYGGRMLDLDHIHVYAWDARPWPAFPANTNVWGDGPNWRLGHWISGRTAAQPVSAIVHAVLADYGFTDGDASRLSTSISGYVLDRPMTAREALQPLELACFFDAVESEGRIHFRHRGTEGPVVTLSSDDVVEVGADAPLLTLTRAQETELPASARLVYVSAPSEYRQAVVESRRLVGASGRIAQAELAIVMDAEQAAGIADTWLFETWAARDRVAFTLPPSSLALEPGDLVSLDHAGRTRLLRIVSVGEHGARDVEALSIDPSVYASGTDIVRAPTPTAEIAAGPALGLFLDLPLLTGNEAPDAGWVAAAKAPWPGGVAFYLSPESSGFTLAATARRPAITGITLLPLASSVESRFDRAGRLTVQIDIGTLSTVTRLALLAGANAAAVQAPAGAWEVLQFETATLVSPGVYELQGLLRGQAGTEAGITATIPAGSRFVLLDEALTPVPLSRDDIGLAFNWRYGPANRDIGDASFTSAVHAFAGVGLRPLSPVHVRGERTGGDLTVTWVRRTRIGGDTWHATEVPLAEDTERYEIDILSGTSVVRTIAATTPLAHYTAAQQTADFGAPQPTISLRIHQLGALGRGTPRNATV